MAPPKAGRPGRTCGRRPVSSCTTCGSGSFRHPRAGLLRLAAGLVADRRLAPGGVDRGPRRCDARRGGAPSAGGFAGGVCFLVLAPTSSLLPIPTEIVAEHRIYLPVAAIVTTLVWRVPLCPPAGGPAASRRGIRCRPGADRRVHGGHPRQQSRLLERRGDLGDTVAKRPDNARARLNYTIDLMAASATPRPRRRCAGRSRCLRIAPPVHRVTCTRRGAVRAGQADRGHRERPAGAGARSGAARRGRDSRAGLQRSQDIAKALPHFKRALQRTPDNALLLWRFTWLAATGDAGTDDDRRMAVTTGERAATLTARQHVGVLEALGAAYARTGRFAGPWRRHARHWHSQNHAAIQRRRSCGRNRLLRAGSGTRGKRPKKALVGYDGCEKRMSVTIGYASVRRVRGTC